MKLKPIVLLIFPWWIGMLTAAVIDQDGNGMCDVWQARFHASGLVADDDGDGDGLRNIDEARAGTDPFDPNDGFAARLEKSPFGLSLTVSTQVGKRYQLAHAPSPNGPWSGEGTTYPGDGNTLSVNPPAIGEKRFYRMEATDADSDNDGVSDWAEAQLFGYDPANPNTFSATGGDLAGVLQWLDALGAGQLTVDVINNTAVEKEETAAEISYLLASPIERPFTLFFKTRGPVNSSRSHAGAGDWTFSDSSGNPLTHRMVISPGETNAGLEVIPVGDTLTEVPEYLRILVGGSSLDSEIRITDAANITGNQRLLVAYLQPAQGIASLGSGLATVRLPGDNDIATVAVSFSNLNSPVSSVQVQTENSAILQSVPPANYGGRLWPIRASQFYLTDQAVLDALLSGQIRLGVFTEAHVTGEIIGPFQITNGSTEFQQPPAPEPPAILVGAALDRDILRFLTQATFGPTPAEFQAMRDLVASYGGDRMAAYSAWIDAQIASPAPSLEAYTRAANNQEIALNPAGFDPNQNNLRRGWWLFARHAPDQLRQRMGFALSEIFVVSLDDSVILNRAYGASNYVDMLGAGAFGPYRQLLENVSLHPIMAQYLSHLKNQPTIFDGDGNPITSPDENYAREIMQLFSIGLVQLHPDGSLKLGSDGLPIQTYTQDDIANLARVFTGLSFSKRHDPVGSDNVVDNTNFFQGNGNERFEASWSNPMKMFPAYHDTGVKSVLGLEIPGGQTGEQDIAEALDHLATQPNTAPFICRRLIQRLVTANPSPGYLYRAATAFTNSGGNLGNTVRAILLDPEARSPELADTIVGAGKVREPIIRYTAFLRAFDVTSELLLSDLSAYGYPAGELAIMPAGVTRVRLGSTDGSLGQSPLAAPSVFNWFVPGYAPSGSLSSNGLVSPELQIANENSTFTANNYIYSQIYNTFGQGGNSLPGQDTPPSTYSANADHLILPFGPLQSLYLDVVDVNGDGSFTSLDVGKFNNLPAITTACEAVLDHVDLMLCGGALKARYGSTPGKPRSLILNAAASVRSSSNSSNSATTQASVMRDRIEDILWLVATSPEFVVQK